MGTSDQFILASTGTWCIFMNPFNSEPLTAEQLRKDSLCYMSIQQRQVKSSRLFMGHMHDVNVENLNHHFGTSREFYKTVKTGDIKIARQARQKQRYFFKEMIPEDYIDRSANLSVFLTFDEAYHQLMADLVDLAVDSMKLIIPAEDQTKIIYISGGFSRNEIFTRLLATRMPDKIVRTSQVDNATALGAAMVIYSEAFGTQTPKPLNR
jgi:sugar (pentulose or hexulose) kinase